MFYKGEIHIEEDWINRTIKLIPFSEGQESTVLWSLDKNGEWLVTTIDKGALIPNDLNFLKIPDQMAPILAEKLLKYLPKETESKKEASATLKHLEDMRTIAFSALNMSQPDREVE